MLSEIGEGRLLYEVTAEEYFLKKTKKAFAL